MSSTVEPPVAEPTLPPPQATISFDEFLTTYAGVHAEWIDGEVILMSPATSDHQEIKGLLLALIRIYVEIRGLGRTLDAPFTMRTTARPTGREPDLLFVSSERTELIKRTFLDGPADLAIEIISPESDQRDRGEKFVEYEAAGVREYWLIDPLRSEAMFYQLGADQRYHSTPLDANGCYHSAVLAGFWLRAAWLWQRPLPPVLSVLHELGVL